MARTDMATRMPETVSSATETAEFAEFVRTDDRVRSRAYEIYQARRHCGGGGDALADWIAAERDLKAGDDDEELTARIGAESGGSEI